MDRLVEPSAKPRSEISVAAGNLVVDAVAGEVIRALTEAEIPSVLLRGPAVARRLYSTGDARTYSDVDLLVPPLHFVAAEELLARLGFVESALEAALPEERPGHAHTWIGRRGGVCVDLHRTLIGAEADLAQVWPVLAAETEPMAVGEVEATVLREAGSALVAALHAAHHGLRQEQPLADLGRALERFSPDVWRHAASLAQRISATPAFTAGLLLLPAGEAVADELGLQRESSRPSAIRGHAVFHVAQGLDWMGRQPGLRAKAIFLARKMAPPPVAMRESYSLARRGRLGLSVAYVWRFVWLSRHVPRAVRVRRRARR